MKEDKKNCHDHTTGDEHPSGCNCNHEQDPDSRDREPRKIYLTLEDDRELECDVLDIFEVDQKSYIAVLPRGSETALLYRFSESNGEPQLSNIEQEEEYQQASARFTQRQQGH